MKLLSIVVCFLCVSFSVASERYRAGVLHTKNKEISAYTPHMHEAGKSGVDILVLPALSENADNYDEVVTMLSRAAQQASLYVVSHLFEKTRCQHAYETVRSNLVFDRKGAIVAVKPQNGVANCTEPTSDLVTFATDFGVTFGLLMEEDLVLYEAKHLKGVNNFVMTGDFHSEVPFLDAAYFAPSWSYTTNANLISTAGIYSGKAGMKTASERLAVADLYKNGENAAYFAPSWSYTTNANLISTAGIYSGKAGMKTASERLAVADLYKNGENADASAVPSFPSTLNFPGEDLNQYVLRPLDLEASSEGYKESVCHRSFCCQFYVKTGETGNPETSYNLAAFNGARPFSPRHSIGTQICGVFTNNGASRPENNILFERISIAANFTKHTSQYPIVQSTAVLPTEKFKFDTKADGICQQVTLDITYVENVVSFGIFGKDSVQILEDNYVFEKNTTESSQNEIYDYIFNEDVQEFFDYVWIRLRILLVVVSIYILEMM